MPLGGTTLCSSDFRDIWFREGFGILQLLNCSGVGWKALGCFVIITRLPGRMKKAASWSRRGLLKYDHLFWQVGRRKCASTVGQTVQQSIWITHWLSVCGSGRPAFLSAGLLGWPCNFPSKLGQLRGTEGAISNYTGTTGTHEDSPEVQTQSGSVLNALFLWFQEIINHMAHHWFSNSLLETKGKNYAYQLHDDAYFRNVQKRWFRIEKTHVFLPWEIGSSPLHIKGLRMKEAGSVFTWT